MEEKYTLMEIKSINSVLTSDYQKKNSLPRARRKRRGEKGKEEIEDCSDVLFNGICLSMQYLSCQTSFLKEILSNCC